MIKTNPWFCLKGLALTFLILITTNCGKSLDSKFKSSEGQNTSQSCTQETCENPNLVGGGDEFTCIIEG